MLIFPGICPKKAFIQKCTSFFPQNSRKSCPKKYQKQQQSMLLKVYSNLRCSANGETASDQRNVDKLLFFLRIFHFFQSTHVLGVISLSNDASGQFILLQNAFEAVHHLHVFLKEESFHKSSAQMKNGSPLIVLKRMQLVLIRCRCETFAVACLENSEVLVAFLRISRTTFVELFFFNL